MRKSRRYVLILTLVLLLVLFRFVGDIGPDRTIGDRYLVARVIDGDTIELTDGEKVRLLGIDTPERGDPFYDSARFFLESLVAGKVLEAEYAKRRRDGYGRILAFLFADTMFINAALLRSGLATVYLFEDNMGDKERVEILLAAQNEAALAGRGLWSLTISPEKYYVAKRGALRFHRPFCRSVSKLKPEEMLRFDSRLEAFQAGYSPCRNCRP